MILREISQKFGASESSPLSFRQLSQLQTDTFAGQIGSECIRPLCWRLFFGILTPRSQNAWAEDLTAVRTGYEHLKSEVVPRMVAKEDPLLALLGENDSSDCNNDKDKSNSNGNGNTSSSSNSSSGSGHKSREWDAYYKSVDLGNFIKGDLQRLYVSGIADEYFENTRIRDILLNILLVWALKHPEISYRQGMHEVCGPILYVLEKEYECWYAELTKGSIQPDSHPLALFFTERPGSRPADAFLEANCFYLLDRVMEHMGPLYDPTNGPDGVAQIVKFCSKIQEHYLRQYDPQLCEVLEDRCIQSHLYGMKWTRLLFGREFSITHNEGLRIWDFIFCYCLDTQGVNAQPSDVASEISNSNTSKEALLAKSRYGPHSLLLAGVSDVMLAMILAIREELLDSDECMCLSLLMRYPQPTTGYGSTEDAGASNVQALLDAADEIRRGVYKNNRMDHNSTNSGRSVSGARRKSFNRNSSGSGSGSFSTPRHNTPPLPPAVSVAVTESEQNALNSLLGTTTTAPGTGTVVAGSAVAVTPTPLTIDPASAASARHKDSVNSWLNSAPTLPLFLSDSLEAGRRVASNMLLFSPNTPPGAGCTGSDGPKSLLERGLDMSLDSNSNNSSNSTSSKNTSSAKTASKPLFPVEQPRPAPVATPAPTPRIRKRDIIRNLIMPGSSSKPTAGSTNTASSSTAGGAGVTTVGASGSSADKDRDKDRELVDDEQHMSISRSAGGHTALAMVSKDHSAQQTLQASGVVRTNTVQPSKIVKQYSSHTQSELIEDRLRTLAELLQGCSVTAEMSGGGSGVAGSGGFRGKNRGIGLGLGLGLGGALRGQGGDSNSQGSYASHSSNDGSSAVTPAFIADKMVLLADILAGLYSIPEYDDTFMTLVGGNGNDSSSSGGGGNSNDETTATATVDEVRGRSGSAVTTATAGLESDPLGLYTATAATAAATPAKKSSGLKGQGYMYAAAPTATSTSTSSTRSRSDSNSNNSNSSNDTMSNAVSDISPLPLPF